MRRAVVFLGSVASGKTTVARSLVRWLREAGLSAKYVDININHGFSYLLTKALTKVLCLRYKSNYYLTIRFNRPDLFCRILGPILLLDVIYAPLKLIYSVLIPGAIKDVLLIDEYYPNGLVDYIYYTRRLCRLRGALHTALLKAMAMLALTPSLALLRRGKCYTAMLLTDLRSSIERWVGRERIPDVDVDHILYRRAGAAVMGAILEEVGECEKMVFEVRDPRKDSGEVAKQIIKEVARR